MSNRCPSCSKFATLETQDPEMVNVEITDGSITASIRVVRNAECCGNEMKEYIFEIAYDATDELENHLASKKHLEFSKGEKVEIADVDFSADADAENTESGGGRYKKNMLGVDVTFKITCECGETITVEAHDEVSASSFDEMN